MDLVGRKPVSDKLSVSGLLGSRYYFDEYAWRSHFYASMRYSFNDVWTGEGGVKFVEYYGVLDDRVEVRPWQGFTVDTKINNNFVIKHNPRVEERFYFEGDSFDFNVRLRYGLSSKFDLWNPNGVQALRMPVGFELLYDLGKNNKLWHDQARYQMGLEYLCNEKLQFNFNLRVLSNISKYENELVKDKSVVSQFKAVYIIK